MLPLFASQMANDACYDTLDVFGLTTHFGRPIWERDEAEIQTYTQTEIDTAVAMLAELNHHCECDVLTAKYAGDTDKEWDAWAAMQRRDAGNPLALMYA